MVELLGVAEDQPWRDADALLQRPHMQLLGIDPPRQADPQDEASSGTTHLRAFGEVLLHRQLKGAEVLAVLLADIAQVPVIAAVLQVRGDAHLRDAARGVGAEGLEPLDFLLEFTRDHPADAHARRQRLGKTRTVDDPVQPVVGLEGLGAPLFEHQLAIDVVLDDLDVEVRSQAQQLLLPLFGDSAAQRVAKACGQYQRLDRPLIGRQLQRFQTDAGGRVAGDLDHLQPEQISQLQQAVIGGRLRSNQIPRAGQYAQ
ncbi:hypothetical protein D3C75_773300 [compost metagenome]